MIKKYKLTSTKSYVCNKTNKEKEKKKELNQKFLDIFSLNYRQDIKEKEKLIEADREK